MDTGGMVGAMGLTFFCNRCVESLHKFKVTGEMSDELEKVCGIAIAALNSLKWPREHIASSAERVALFNTVEEVESFGQALKREGNQQQALDSLIERLKTILDSTKTPQHKKESAEYLQKFFDVLGDFSYYSARECIRSSGSMVGV